MIETPENKKDYLRQIEKALDDKFLAESLASFAASYKQSRQNAFAGRDFKAMARCVADHKTQALSRLDELYARFRERAEAKGVQVHWAADAAQANAIIAGIAADNDCRKVVKSKSMTAEETHLNDYLEARGLTVTESDLGEWIIQLRREGPSHMVMPAIHLRRGQVAELFRSMGGEMADDDIEAMVKYARRELRRAYLEADMGISGANFAVAETGAIGLVTNEGNARLTTTLPRVHVALVGLEKLVPDMTAALDILEVLPKNATGQKITSYVSWITGCNPCRASQTGRKEMHIVFLDNGRSLLAKDPVFSEALRCIRCGACANLCPIYSKIGGHAYGHVYIGAIGLILTYFYHGVDKANALITNCLNCQQCKELCPAGIDLPRLIKQVQELVQESKGLPAKNRVIEFFMKNRRAFHTLLRAAWLGQQPIEPGQPFIRHLPEWVMRPAHNFRALPKVVRTPLRDRWEGMAPQPINPKLKVGFFAGCLTDFVYPEQGEAFAKLITGQGVAAELPKGQTCCGLPAYTASSFGAARDAAKLNLDALDPAGYDYIVTLCASCASHIKENYPGLLAAEPGYGVKAGQLAAKIIDFASFARDVLKLGPSAIKGPKACYHSPCHLCRGLGVHEAPRDLLAGAADYQPLDNEETCCGFGGSYSLDYPEISARILDGKLKAVVAAGAEVLATDCPGCVLQLRGGAIHQGLKLEVKHLAEVLAAAKGL